MKKFMLTILTCLMASSAFAFGDFFRFENPYNNNFYRHNITPGFQINRTHNNWSNPYDYSLDNPVSKFVKTKRMAKKSILGLKDNPDFEYLLSKMEQKNFGQTYSDYDIDSRLSRLETEIFGASQSGDIISRLNRLKRAFSSHAIDSKNNNLRSFFSSGMPTSIPMSNDYYSSLNSFDFLP